MSEQRFEAREKRLQRMSRDGLLEENASSGEVRRISKRAQENAISLETVPPDADDPRHLEEPSLHQRKLYAEQSSEAEATWRDRPGKARKRQYEKAVRERMESDEQPEEDTPEGGTTDGAQSSQERVARNRKRYRKGQLGDQTDDRAERSQQSPSEVVSPEDPGEEGDEENERLTSEQSARMGSVREHSSALSETAADTAADLRHSRNKKQVQKYAMEESRKKQRLSEVEPERESLSDRKDELVTKRKKERLNQEQRKQKAATEQGKKKPGRLSFEDESGDGMVHGSGTGFGRHAAAAAAVTGAVVHSKLSEESDDNASVDAAHDAGRLAEETIRRQPSSSTRPAKSTASRRKSEDAGVSRLNFGEEPAKVANAAQQEAEEKTTIRKFFQKQRYRRMYANAKKQEKATEQVFRASQNIVTKAAVVVRETVRRNSKVLIVVGFFALFLFLISSALSSCTALLHGAGSTVVSTTYASTDAEIHKVENTYRQMELDLNRQINSIESRYPEYDEFRYQIDEISHNPYRLISYFTAKYGEFTYSQVRSELEEIFREQYSISTAADHVTVTETRTVRVGESLGRVVTSGYCSCPICCGVWSGGPTASGVYPTSNHTIAVDASNPFVPLGTHVVMNGVEYVVEDTGAFDQYGVQFDVYYDSHSEALNHGHRTWEAYIASSNGSQEVEVTSTREVNRLSVTLTNHNLDTVLLSRMDENERKRFTIYNLTYGNRDYLFDKTTLPYSPLDGPYTIPREALSDERFANMIREAEKYLGYPFVWGGSSPSTSFDCSGFVSWVINHCGNGWNYGRLTAEGLRQICAYVPYSSAKPGDLVFFQGTYDCGGGASHVGIYVGDGMMIHCGDPIRYTSINTAYWQEHFLSFGRLP